MVLVCVYRVESRVWLLVVSFVLLISTPGASWDGVGRSTFGVPWTVEHNEAGPRSTLSSAEGLVPRIGSGFQSLNDYLIKIAYGRTFGTSTDLDYATLELSKSVSRHPVATSYGPTVGELHLAVLASYVLYYGGTIERVKRLDFRDGFEVAWLPKGRFTFPGGVIGMVPYGECGAGIGYVSETYRNSGSRFNWSLLGGFGLERRLKSHALIALGVQWRHLSNGNMWGTGDELHNSNSGTDMIQGLATFLHIF
ncbi:MAG: acyloxyacyl hydrolase [Desulfomonile sp.]|nr:acyloxyacyl hydrolase [Deltaproteobacteria bacterium]